MIWATFVLATCLGDVCSIHTEKMGMDSCLVMAEMSEGHCVPDMTRFMPKEDENVVIASSR